MSISLALGITQFDELDMDPDGLYHILPGHTHIFPFQVPFLNSTKILTHHLFPNSQDWTVSWWLSSHPLDGIVLSPGFGHARMSRTQQSMEIFDTTLKAPQVEDHRLFLPSMLTHYINVKNLQNSSNGYQLLVEPQTLQELPGLPEGEEDLPPVG